MMNRVSGFLLMSLLLFVSACNKDESGSSNAPSALVSMYALSPDAPNLNLFISGTNVATSIPFGSYTLYNQVAPGNTAVRVQTTAGAIAVDTIVTTSEGSYYSLFLIDSLNSLKSVFLHDSLSTPATDTTVRLRFFTFSPDAPAVDIHVSSADSSLQQVWWQNRKFTDNAASDSINTFISKPAGTYNFYILKNSSKDTLITFKNKSFTNSASYTLLLEGKFTNADKSDTTLQFGIRRH